jgi:Do/DeqQ family serine protease
MRFLSQTILSAVLAALLLYIFAPSFYAPKVVLQQSSEMVSSSNPLANGFRPAIAKASAAVVSIRSEKTRTLSGQMSDLFNFFHPDILKENSLGSGVIVSADGYVVTNDHVINGAKNIEVRLNNGKTFVARLIGQDPETDLAVLKIDSPDPLPVITFGDSRAIQAGDIALAIGNPFGVGQTITQGIISSENRKRLGLSTYEDFLQTDAAINPGNSGGALVNVQGELIGINTVIFSETGGSQGIGFAIPVDLALFVIKQLIEKGTVVRGWLGIQIESVKAANVPGGQVAGIINGSPAAQAGLRAGDIIQRIDQKEIKNAEDLLYVIAQLTPGQTVTLEGLRQNRPSQWQVRIGRRPAAAELR